MTAASVNGAASTAVLLAIACVVLAPAAAVFGQHSELVQNHTNVCFGRVTGNERNVANCQQSFRCLDGHPTLAVCNGNTVYSHVTQRCETSNATSQAQCFACPNSDTHIDLPADFQCQQYVRCFRGVPEQRVCSPGLLFDPVTRQCNFAERVKCACPATDRPDQPWFIRERNDCGRFNVCIRGLPVQMSCPQGLHFNRTVNQCDTAQEPECIRLDEINNSTTTVAPTPLPPLPPTTTTALPPTTTTALPPIPPTTQPPTSPPWEFRCPNPNVISFEPHPENCELFYICANGSANVSNCPNGSLFDVRTRSCVDAQFAQCFYN